MRSVIREELERVNKDKATVFETSGLTYKPLYKIAEVCVLLQVSKPTIYEWIKLGMLKPFKIRSRVYFLYDDIQVLLRSGGIDDNENSKGRIRDKVQKP
jgi:excisionase family DNA binding protein